LGEGLSAGEKTGQKREGKSATGGLAAAGLAKKLLISQASRLRQKLWCADGRSVAPQVRTRDGFRPLANKDACATMRAKLFNTVGASLADFVRRRSTQRRGYSSA